MSEPNPRLAMSVVRHHAASLALIGLAIDDRSEPSANDHVTVEFDAWQIGAALDAAQERDLLKDIRPPSRGH